MPHDPSHSPHSHSDTGNLRVAFFLNLAFTLIEIVGGLWTNSVAIISDAIHDLGDSLSLGLSWYFQHLSGRQSDTTYSFGYQRFSLLGAVINSLVLVIGAVLVLQEAIPRLWTPEQPQTLGMIWLAVVGILVNGAAVLRLRGGDSLNAKAVGLHLLEDVLGWTAVLIGAIVMRFVDAPFLDPLLSISITGWVLFNVYRNLRESFRIFLQAVPANKDITGLKAKIRALPEVAKIQDIHLWTLDGSYDIFTVQLVSGTPLSAEATAELRQQVRALLAELSVEHCTVEICAPGETAPARHA